MSLTTFFTIYAKRALRDRKIPFEITALALAVSYRIGKLPCNIVFQVRDMNRHKLIIDL